MGTPRQVTTLLSQDLRSSTLARSLRIWESQIWWLDLCCSPFFHGPFWVPYRHLSSRMTTPYSLEFCIRLWHWARLNNHLTCAFFKEGHPDLCATRAGSRSEPKGAQKDQKNNLQAQLLQRALSQNFRGAYALLKQGTWWSKTKPSVLSVNTISSQAKHKILMTWSKNPPQNPTILRDSLDWIERYKLNFLQLDVKVTWRRKGEVEFMSTPAVRQRGGMSVAYGVQGLREFHSHAL